MRFISSAAAVLTAVVLGHASVGSNFPGSETDTTLNVTSTFTGGSGVGIHSKSTVANGVGLAAKSTGLNGTGVAASSVTGAGLSAEGGTFGVSATGITAGVSGTSSYGDGVLGNSSRSAGVRGFSANSYGVYGESPTSGVMGFAYSNGPGVTGHGSMGVLGIGTAASGANGVGVYAWGSGGTTAYGIIASAAGGAQENWAGWFDGNVAITGMCSPCVISDGRTKKNIKSLKGSLKKVMAMSAKSYEMKTGEYASTMNLAEGPQNGLIAQELETIVPEAVHEVTAPPHYTEEERKRGVKKEGVVLKSVNYTALIPLLIAAIQEQQKEIDALKAGR